jgi:hypothetical protein
MVAAKEKEAVLSNLQLRSPDEAPNALAELLESRKNDLPAGQ